MMLNTGILFQTGESPASCVLDVTKRMLSQAGCVEMWEEECGVMVNLFYHALLRPSYIDRVLLRGFVADFVRKCKYLPKYFVY